MFSVCIDRVGYFSKPAKKEFSFINNRIAFNEEMVSIEGLLNLIIDNRFSWCPSVFYNRTRSNDNFKSKQLFGLDFDRGISWEEVQARAVKYNLPILFSYETLSSVKQNRFRVVFCNVGVIDNIRIADAIQNAIMLIFPEADRLCKDASRLFLGGKKVIYQNTTARINFYDLMQGMTKYTMDFYGKDHYYRNIKNYCQTVGLACKNNLVHVELAATDGGIDNVLSFSDNFGEIDASPIVLYIGNVQNSPNYCKIYLINSFIRGNKRNKKTFTLVNNKSTRNLKERNIDFNTAREKCRLFKEFCNGERWLYHHELFGIATNILRTSGGEAEFFEALNSDCNKEYHSYQDTDWRYQVFYIKKQEYYSQQCDYFCPYKDTCKHCDTMLQTIKTKRNKVHKISTDESYCTLDELEVDLQKKIIDAIEDCGRNIHIIKSQTGSGKSKTYKDFMLNSDKQFLIAAPTNALKREILSDLHKMGIEAKATPSLKEFSGIAKEIINHVEYLYCSGMDKEVSIYLRGLVNEGLIDASVEYYLKEIDSLSSYSGHLVTTHARLLTFSAERLKKYTVIVDEDIMRTLIQTEQININDLYKLDALEGLPKSISKRVIEVITALNNNETYYNFNYVSDGDINLLYDMISEQQLPIGSNLSAFFKAMSGYIDKTNSTINFATIRKLQPDVKYIILSATPFVELYKITHPSFHIFVTECKQAKYKGTLKQYYTNSFSRTYIANNENKLQKIIDYLGENIPIITFKAYKNPAIIPHFGQTEGFNGYKGKDIAVVGTPHNNEIVYKLVALALNKAIDDKLMHMEVEHNNYRFWIMTYTNEFLRQLQFWYIESELEQAVGRARLLREECTVSLFSNYPLKQAELIDDCSFLDETVEEIELQEDMEKGNNRNRMFV